MNKDTEPRIRIMGVEPDGRGGFRRRTGVWVPLPAEVRQKAIDAERKRFPDATDAAIMWAFVEFKLEKGQCRLAADGVYEFILCDVAHFVGKNEVKCNLASKRKPPGQRPGRKPTRREVADARAGVEKTVMVCLRKSVGTITSAYLEGSASGWDPVVLARLHTPQGDPPAFCCEFAVIPRGQLAAKHADAFAAIPPEFFPIIVHVLDENSEPVFEHLTATQRPN